MSVYAEGDVIQITDQAHPWYPALLIVDEVKRWGVQAYVVVPKSNDGNQWPSLAYNRLTYDQIAQVGPALVRTRPASETAEDLS